MNKEIINVVILAGSFLLLFAVAEILYHFLKVRAEYTRKLVHFGTGLLSLLFPLMLSDQWWVLFLCATFAVILVGSLKYNLLRSINAVDRETVGSIAYPVSVYGCYLVYDYHHRYAYYYLPILVLAICDPIAALSGKKWPLGKYKVGKDNKTMMGSGMFFLSCLVLSALLLKVLGHEKDFNRLFAISIVISLIAAVTEALSRRGFDNITIPASVLGCLVLFEQFTH